MTAGENTTVYGVVSDVDVLNYAASTSELFEVTGTVIARQGVPIALPGETASDDVQLEIPEVFNLEVRIDDPVGPMNAGADTILRVFVQNNGNIADRVSETDVSVDCTLITVGTQTSEITNKEIAPGATITANLVFEAALSHPSRSCDVDIQIVSQGSDGSQTSSDSTRIEVQAATGESGDKEPVDDGSGTVEVDYGTSTHRGIRYRHVIVNCSFYAQESVKSVQNSLCIQDRLSATYNTSRMPQSLVGLLGGQRRRLQWPGQTAMQSGSTESWFGHLQSLPFCCWFFQCSSFYQTKHIILRM